jgi:hypothetical protein
MNLKATPAADNAAAWIIHIAKETCDRKHSGNKTYVDKEYLNRIFIKTISQTPEIR